jgi:putative FmdB family regulatory protein
MPIYEYECQKCGERFEQYCKTFGDDKDVKCPACGEEKPVKLVTSFASKTGGDSCAPRGGG